MISLVTCTGGRPELFKLTEHFMKRQFIPPQYQWIVVDDCTPPTKCTMGQLYIRGPRDWTPGLNTQRYNMELALEQVKGEWIYIIEDDDYYAPAYLTTMHKHLETMGAKAVGIGNAKYYHVGVPGYKYLRNYTHAALSMTAFHVSLLPILKEAVNSGEFFFDSFFWRKVMNQRIPFTIINNSTLSVGLKGLPGRNGLTHSHREKKDYLYDQKHARLKEWLGKDYSLYVPFLRDANRGVTPHALNIERPQNTFSDDQTLRPQKSAKGILF